MGLKMREANGEALSVEEKCVEVIALKNKKWKVSDNDLGALKPDGRWQGSFAGPYLQWLMEDGVVEADSRDISDLEAVSGFKS